MRAADYLVMANTYVQAINRGGVPTITDAWTEVVEGHARAASAKGLRYYQKEIKQYLQSNSEGEGAWIDTGALKVFHKKLRAQCLELLEKVLNSSQSQGILSDQSKDKLRQPLTQ